MWALIIAGVVVLFWPNKKSGEFKPHVPDTIAPDAPAKTTKYIDSVAALQTVRERLLVTDQLDEEQQEAINTLTLALVAGSEQ